MKYMRRRDYLEVLFRAVRTKGITPRAVCLLVFLMIRCGPDFWVRDIPTVEMGGVIHVTERQISTLLTNLEQHGFITRASRANKTLAIKLECLMAKDSSEAPQVRKNTSAPNTGGVVVLNQRPPLRSDVDSTSSKDPPILEEEASFGPHTRSQQLRRLLDRTVFGKRSWRYLIYNSDYEDFVVYLTARYLRNCEGADLFADSFEQKLLEALENRVLRQAEAQQRLGRDIEERREKDLRSNLREIVELETELLDWLVTTGAQDE